MRRFPRCRGLAVTGVLLAPFCVPFGNTYAQSDDTPPGNAETTTALESFELWTARTEAYEAIIGDEESVNGPHSRALLEPLLSLALVHREYGRRDLAVETLHRAVQVKRVNDGLFNLEQVPLVREVLDIELERGNFTAAAELEGHLLRLARLNPDDLRSVPIFQEAADRQLALYERYLAGEGPPQIEIDFDFFGGSAPSRRAPSPRAMALAQARRNYTDAIRGMLRNGVPADQNLIDLEKRLIRTYYLEMTSRNTLPERAAMLYSLGVQSHRRLVAYSALGSGTVVDFARALVNLADWELLFSRNGQAVDRYEEAYRMLTDAGVPDAEIREIFPAEAPVPLPTFLPNPLNEPDPQAPHIDVAFELSRYGRSRRIEVLDTSADAPDDAVRDLVRLIARNRFRPGMPDEPRGRDATYSLRYYVAD